MILSALFGLNSGDMGIDLGTVNTLVYLRGKGIVLREPSLVARRQRGHEVIAVGDEAKRMLGRTPESIEIIRPLKGGVIADFETTYQMLRYYIGKVSKRRMFFHPRMVVGVPSGSTPTERRAVVEAGMQAGAREVFLVEEPMAAAVGVRLPVNQATASMVIDIGGGTTDAVVISMGGIVVSASARVAGDAMDAAIINYMRHVHGLLIGDVTAESSKMAIGAAYPFRDERCHEINGRDLRTGLPRTVKVTSVEMREALRDVIDHILETIKSTLERTPPELASDLFSRGIVLSGGGALLAGLDRFISENANVPTFVAKDALSSVALGAGMIIENLDGMKRLCLASNK